MVAILYERIPTVALNKILIVACQSRGLLNCSLRVTAVLEYIE